MAEQDDTLTRKLLASDPEDRFNSAVELSATIDAMVEETMLPDFGYSGRAGR